MFHSATPSKDEIKTVTKLNSHIAIYALQMLEITMTKNKIRNSLKANLNLILY